MKKSFIILPAALVLVAACAKETSETYIKAPEITAFQESDGITKSILSVDGEGIGTIYWKPADDIKVFYGTTGVKYTSTNTENSTVAVFETSAVIGATESASTNNWGLYPYDAEATCDGSNVTTTIPSTQYGVPETFDDDLFPTLAHSTTREFQFYNVCGGIKFSLSRADITKITFKGNNNERLAGKVDLTFADDVPVATVVTGATMITLTPKTGDCFAQGSNYYIITLPVSMTGGFTMTFETDTQIGTFNYTTKTVTVSRSTFSKKANIDTYATFVDKEVTDLSSSGTANCYIVSEAGRYKFKTVHGNSTTSVGDVKGVKVLWESFGTDVTPSVGDIIDGGVSYTDNYITFSTNSTFTEGNAVIAAYSDADCTDGNVLWSWHIWCTDQPEEQVYNNNAGTMMDRNLGATSATPGDVHALGLLYQWGRKDPFLSSSLISSSAVSSSTIVWPSPVSQSNVTGTIEYVTKHPTTVVYKYDDEDGTSWSTISDATNLWKRTKTIYDPCPVGWRVPNGGYDSVWRVALGFGTAYDFVYKTIIQMCNASYYGYNFGKTTSYALVSVSDCWYPLSGEINGSGNGRLVSTGFSGQYWTCDLDSDERYCSYAMSLYRTASSGTLYVIGKSTGASVRCQKIQ